ncbi:hypothetical protein ABR737_21025 [Streptomyces sp. Edi2]|uniref:hypothetical protein n=1 Tax=Streptomyces sp. Edi2 TaxID=3162528 RepID=UPI003305FE0D
MNKDDPKVRSAEENKESTKRASSEILGLIALKGKLAESGPFTMPCSGYSGGVYRDHHPWSLYDVPIDDMKEAMDRLRKGLPRKGWKIVKDGFDGSPSKAPQIVANSKGEEFSVDIRLHDQRKYGKDPSFIEVTLESACFKTEKPD